MWFRSWLDVLGIGTQPRRSRPGQRSGDRRRRQSRRLLVEGLEQRQLLAFLPAVDFPVGTNPVAVVAADTLSITGTFRSAESANINGFQYPGTIGADLAEVYANSNENAWMLTLHGISYSHDYYYNEWGYGHGEEYITRVYATSADFEFFGPDADVLNEVVSQQLVGGFFELRHGYQLGSLFADDDGPYRFLELGLFGEGVSFYVNGSAWGAQFSADEQGYPVVEPQLVWAYYSTITDLRPGNDGGLVSFADLMHIDLAGPPLPLPPSLRVNDVTVTEGNTGTALAGFVVTLSAASTETVTVAYATGNDTAAAGSDFNSTSGIVTFAPGETSQTITVPVIGDRLAEPNETFVVNLSSPTNATIADGQGVGTILDDEPRISVNNVTVTEGNTGSENAVFTVTLSHASDEAVTVAFATANGTAGAGSDYTAASGNVTIPAGQLSQTFMIAVKGDRFAEPNETFFVNLSSPTNATIADGQGVGTVLDNEPRISVSDVTKSEGRKGQTTLFTFTVTLLAAYDQPVTMSYATANGTAKSSDNDYIAKAGTLTFAPGQTSKTITIEVKGDNRKEANETFYLDLFGNSSNSSFTKSRGVGTILNDD